MGYGMALTRIFNAAKPVRSNAELRGAKPIGEASRLEMTCSVWRIEYGRRTKNCPRTA